MKTRLFGKLAYRCKLIRPLPVFGWRDTSGPCVGQYIITDEHKFNFGVGPTKSEALVAFKHILADDYRWLKKQETILSPSLRTELDYLQQFVRRY